MDLNDLLLVGIAIMTFLVTYANVKEAYQKASSFRMALGGGLIALFVTVVYSVLFWIAAFIFSLMKNSDFAALETLLYIPISLLFCAILTIFLSSYFKLLGK